jgi:penicillin-binding protein 1A
VFSIKNLLKLALIAFLLGVIALTGLYFSLKDELPSVETLKNVQWQTPMRVYSADGELISQFGEKKRIPLTLEQVPQQLINALLATEDDRFYLHFGIDPIGLGRAILGQITGQNRGGASTITMQVARNFFLSREQTYIRKLKEIFIALHIEKLLTKDEILMLYINKIELGHRAFGFGAAAQVYYGKDVSELTLPEMAMLAGLPKAPSTLNPITNPAKAKQRRAVVLYRMLKQGYITQLEFQQAVDAPITASKHGAEISLHAPYIAEMVRKTMVERYGLERAYTEGFNVYTTVTSKLQRAAEQALKTNLYRYDQRHGYRGPIKQLLPDTPANDSRTHTTDITASSTEQQIDSRAIDNSSAFIAQNPIFQTNDIIYALASVISYDTLQPAFVRSITATSADISLLSTDQTSLIDAIIPWDNMKWARRFISDDQQDIAPSSPSDVLAVGDIVYVKTTNNPLVYQLSQLPEVSSALVALSPDDGAIEALVGGFSFKLSEYNRAIQAKRQVGSNIKPFIYSAAIDHGFTLASLINDAPINQWDRKSGIAWRPKNSPPIYVGPLRMRLGLAQSKNVISVRLLRKVGLNNVINHLSLFGFPPDELPRNESLALGSASFTPLEVATGFAVFANGGFLIKPYLIQRITDGNNNIVFQARPTLACDPCQTVMSLTDNNSVTESTADEQPTINQAQRAISAENAFLITQAMNSVIWGADWSVKPGWQGTGFRARVLKRRDIAGKTGTTNEAKDAWFSGFSRRIVATSWIGFDDHRRNLGKTSYNPNLGKNQIIGKEFGAKSAQPAWIDFMRTALQDLPVEPFIQPDNIISVRIDKATGKLATKTDNTTTFEYFIKGTEPTEYATKDHSDEIFDTIEKTTSPPINNDDIFNE